MRWFRHLAALALLVGGAAIPATAPAQSSGGGSQGGTVTVDPNSPAGTEYDIPIARARRNGDKGAHHTKKGSDLFGAGIKPATKKPASVQPKPKPKPSRHRKHTKHKRTVIPIQSARPGRIASNQVPTSPSAASGAGALLAILGGGLGVVAFGAIGGWLLRRRTS